MYRDYLWFISKYTHDQQQQHRFGRFLLLVGAKDAPCMSRPVIAHATVKIILRDHILETLTTRIVHFSLALKEYW
jgi:hypothetical protein